MYQCVFLLNNLSNLIKALVEYLVPEKVPDTVIFFVHALLDVFVVKFYEVLLFCGGLVIELFLDVRFRVLVRIKYVLFSLGFFKFVENVGTCAVTQYFDLVALG